MKLLQTLSLAAITVGSLVIASLPASASTILVSRYGGTFIGALDSSGSPSNPNFLDSGACCPIGIAVDSLNGRFYWGDGGTFAVRSANLDGSGVTTLTTLNSPNTRTTDMAIDSLGGFLYYSADIGAQIGRINLSTGVRTTLFSFSQGYGIAVDPEAGKLYYSSDGNRFIGQANLDGTGIISNFIDMGVGAGAYGLGIDLVNDRLYWAGSNARIGSANLDGTGVLLNIVSVSNVRDVTVDPSIGRIFYTNNGVIGAANLDGSSANNNFATGYGSAWGIATSPIPEPSAYLLSLTGLGALLAVARRNRK
jgi:hypothetical protein